MKSDTEIRQLEPTDPLLAGPPDLSPTTDLPDAPPELQRQVLREMRASFLREYQTLRTQALVHRDIGNTHAVEEITKSMELGRKAIAAIDLRLGMLGNASGVKS